MTYLCFSVSDARDFCSGNRAQISKIRIRSHDTSMHLAIFSFTRFSMSVRGLSWPSLIICNCKSTSYTNQINWFHPHTLIHTAINNRDFTITGPREKWRIRWMISLNKEFCCSDSWNRPLIDISSSFIIRIFNQTITGQPERAKCARHKIDVSETNYPQER